MSSLTLDGMLSLTLDRIPSLTLDRVPSILLDDTLSEGMMFSYLSFAIFRRLRRTPFPANTLYTTGTITKVIKVDTESPHATVIPIERHISEPSPVPTAIGIIPNTVVRVVINTGRRRD